MLFEESTLRRRRCQLHLVALASGDFAPSGLDTLFATEAAVY